MLDVMARNWWVLVIRGVFAILFGILAFIWPGLTVYALVFLFGAYALLDGIFNLVGAFSSGERHLRWWATALEGIISIIAGIVAFVWPEITALALLYVIAFWSILTGVMEITGAIQLRHEIRGEWLLILSGIASILFGILLAVLPGAGLLALVWLIGSYAIIFGILLISLGFRLRSHANPGVPRGQGGMLAS